MTFPSREDIRQKLAALCDQLVSREEIAGWALNILDAHEGRIADEKAREILDRMCAADLDAWDEPYLYGSEDFKAWADELSDEPQTQRNPSMRRLSA